MKVWDKIIKVSAILGAVIFIMSSIFGGYSFFARKVIEKERKQQNTIALQNEVGKNSKTDSLIISQFNELNFRFNNLSDTLKIVVQKQNVMINKQIKSDKGLIELYKLTGKVGELVNWWLP
jgi:hypothetical protein